MLSNRVTSSEEIWILKTFFLSQTRFSHQPDKYKQFLEILQKYQQQGQANALGGAALGAVGPGGPGGLGPGVSVGRRLGGSEDRPFSDLQVYKQVSRLFEGQSDLLHEFRTFLPEVNQAMLSVSVWKMFSLF